jgi:hypothetical protein
VLLFDLLNIIYVGRVFESGLPSNNLKAGYGKDGYSDTKDGATQSEIMKRKNQE